MKNTLLTLACMLLVHLAFTQGPDSSQFTHISHYVFPDFVKGTVKQKNRDLQEAMLNYNSITQEMIFIQNNAYLALAELSNIDTVYLESRKFVPAGKIFYEVVSEGAATIFVNHKCRVIPPGKPAGYGTTTQTGSVGNVSKIASYNMSYSLKLPDDFKIIPETEFLLRKGNDFIKIYGAKQVSKVFPDRSAAIQEYVRQNKTNFSRQEDVMKLIRFCNQPQ